ncbi:hypothetical protein [Fructilactobacillus carniphilus]|uniref:Uncharacterized protein n=1 Tax=Fructilactobacillus carniphilus TaxID=2940297 RepID=A0ABY5BW19_9LACO|nr:hypothetical protein [Fructilactobacillus carniphilus]USS90257.1 hypothetical protein M3M37_05290 [Fructilactobacillus carniphilus]
MKQSRKEIINLGAWLALVIMIILFAVQTHTFNVNMVLFIIIVPTLLNLPLFFKSRTKSMLVFQLIMLVISLLIFILVTITMLMNASYNQLIRWSILFLAIIGMIFVIINLVSLISKRK